MPKGTARSSGIFITQGSIDAVQVLILAMIRWYLPPMMHHPHGIYGPLYHRQRLATGIFQARTATTSPGEHHWRWDLCQIM
ncbi:hypothetical protein PHLCEN_2v4781 [Hermanssonia centrifuga]|uniref:Uncharacterized protein n=1 Tax=Hermanssonia centrifuga TaxID=98765 RepID=A0A2R6PJX3_9APHY|nr:hypothetical protein PHLCEN_2v4781 [Hermanssonia centrifuga]